MKALGGTTVVVDMSRWVVAGAGHSSTGVHKAQRHAAYALGRRLSGVRQRFQLHCRACWPHLVMRLASQAEGTPAVSTRLVLEREPTAASTHQRAVQ